VESAHGTLLGVVDALGHGDHAHHAAQRTLEVLRSVDPSDVSAAFGSCNDAAHGSRGVVMTLAYVAAAGTLTWLGVGNIHAVWVPALGMTREWLTIRGGFLGGRLPRLRPKTLPVGPGVLIVIATDGIRPDFGGSLDPRTAVAATAASVLEHHARPEDDALVLAAQVRLP
jgi:hypothetical protein